MNDPIEHIIRQLKSQLNSLAAAFTSMNDALNFSDHTIYYNLSKLIVVVISTSLQIIFLATAKKTMNMFYFEIDLKSIPLVFPATAPKNDLISCSYAFTPIMRNRTELLLCIGCLL